MSDKVFSDSTFTAAAERYADSWNEFSTLNMRVEEQHVDNSFGFLFNALDSVFEVLTYVVVALLILLLLVIIYKQRGLFSGLFSRKYKDHPVEESSSLYSVNIFGHDYDHEIAACLSKEQYAEAIRLVYLKTLYYLQRHNCISWNESKTATEYYYEYRNVKRRPVFHELIDLYLVAVYADNSERPMTETDYQHARELNQIITKL